MSQSIPRLGVIILNYNTRDLLRRCLQSVLRSATVTAERLAVDLLVVDSASTDDSAAMVATEFPAVHLIASPTNLGYTGGNNLGIKAFGFTIDSSRYQSPIAHLPMPNYILILNADTEVNEDALWQMAHFLETTPTAGACGAHLHYGDGSFQHGAFKFPSLAQLVLDFFPLVGLPGMHRLHNSGINGRYPQALWRGTDPFPVDFVLGAALMVRGDLIRQIGALDDGYFMYCEELDWAVRMKLAGWQRYIVPSARVTHYEGQSSKQVRWSAFVRLWRSRLRFYRKYQGRHPIGYLTAVRLTIALGLRWQLWQVDRRFAKGQIDGIAWQEERAAYKEVTRIVQMGGDSTDE